MSPPDETPGPRAGEVEEQPQLCCVGGGKGGVGKSIVALNMAHALAADGLRVVLADLDLGGANLHTLVGLRGPHASLRDFFGGQVQSLAELATPLPELGFSLIQGGDEVAGVVQPGFQRKQKLLRHLRRLEADVVICDLGGNAGLDTLDLFNQADVALLVATPEPTSVQNAYGFVKASILRKVWRAAERDSPSRGLIEQLWDPRRDEVGLSIEELCSLAEEQTPQAASLIRQTVRLSRLELVVNMAAFEEARRTFRTLAGVTQRFLGLQVNYLGHVETDRRIHQLVMRGKPPLIGRELFNPRTWQELVNRFEPAMAVGINEEVRIGDQVLHIQTEDLGRQAGAYCALVYSGGRIILSKKVGYDSPFMARLASSSKKERVRHLHRTVIEAIRSGRIPLGPGAAQGGEESGEAHAVAQPQR